VSSEHSRGHAGHSHGVSADADAGKLTVALGLILGFMALEIAAGAIAHSLALLSDAGHMLTDAAAIGLSLVAARLAARPAKGALTYGFKRVEILSAQVNGVTLLILAALITYEAIRRLFNPPHVQAGLMLIVALVGIAVNLTATWTLARANRQSMNVEGSFQHILTDLYAFIGTAIAEKIGRALVHEPGVVEVHDLHVWEVTSGFPALSAHVLVGRESDCHAARRCLERMLHDEFGLDHTTLQVDHQGGDLLDIEMPEQHDATPHPLGQ
jgi:cobalt-zinc-cadmium efflux system protein